MDGSPPTTLPCARESHAPDARLFAVIALISPPSMPPLTKWTGAPKHPLPPGI